MQGIGPREGVRPGVVWPAGRDATGIDGPTHWGCRSGAWRRSGGNLWVPADVDGSAADQRTVEAAAMLPAYGGVTGWAALHWCGAHWLAGLGRGGEMLPVPLAVGPGKAVRAHAGIAVSQEGVPPGDLVRWDGVRVTLPVRSVAYEMRKALTDQDAIVAFEMAAFNDLVSVDELAAHVESSLGTRHGVERVRRVLPALEENSWSPMEPVMRGIWVGEARLPRPLANRPVFDLDGRFIGTPDLIDAERGVAGEYDGALHLVGAEHVRDVRREAEFRRVGLDPVTMLAGDLSDRRSFVRRLHEAYARADRPDTERGWTLTPPAWWIETVTVAQRRALTPSQRARLLAHRSRAA